jgi:hypothetical protein
VQQRLRDVGNRGGAAGVTSQFFCCVRGSRPGRLANRSQPGQDDLRGRTRRRTEAPLSSLATISEGLSTTQCRRRCARVLPTNKGVGRNVSPAANETAKEFELDQLPPPANSSPAAPCCGHRHSGTWCHGSAGADAPHHVRDHGPVVRPAPRLPTPAESSDAAQRRPLPDGGIRAGARAAGDGRDPHGTPLTQHFNGLNPTKVQGALGGPTAPHGCGGIGRPRAELQQQRESYLQ